MSLQNNIRDLIFFYIKTNYNEYLEDKNIKYIPDNEIDKVINTLYDDRKDHIQVFIKTSLKQIYETNNEKIDNIIRTTSFEVLQKKEEKDGFKEAVNKKIKFFNLGPKNTWKNIIDEKLIYKIEKNFKKEMEELNYL